MHAFITRGTHLFVLLICLLLFGFAPLPAAGGHNDVLHLQAPPFLTVAHAQEVDAAALSAIADEAGIAAYLNVEQAIDLGKVVGLYRSIEAQNADYILGSVTVRDYDENHDVKLYVHKDGWVMAYYPNSEPTSKIFDWRHFQGDATLKITLEDVLDQVVTKIGATLDGLAYYHFAFPNANAMTLIAEKAVSPADDFQVTLPSAFAYYERSWSLGVHETSCCGADGEYQLNAQPIEKLSTRSWLFAQGRFSETQMKADTLHTITAKVDSDGEAYAGLAVIYKEQ
jgi:hypothetical protein